MRAIEFTNKKVVSQSSRGITSGVTSSGLKWKFEAGGEVPFKHDVEANTFIRITNDSGKTVAGVFAEVYGDTIEIEYAEVYDKNLRRKGIYTDVLSSLSKHYDIVSDTYSNNAARGAYEKLGAKHDTRRDRFVLNKQGVTKSFDKEAEAWREWQLKMLPRKMEMLSRLVKGWVPSEEDHIAAIEAGYVAMRETGNVKDAAKAISDTFKEIQSRQGVTGDYHLDKLNEKTIFNPDVGWVSDILSTIDLNDAEGDIYELADLLTDAFSERKIEFDVVPGKFGVGIFKDKLSSKTGLVGAEFVGLGEEPEVIVELSKAAAKLNSFFPEFDARLKQLIKHEYIHKEQLLRKISGSKNKNATLGGSPEMDHLYYADPYEVAAIASEMESQLLKIEPDPQKLISMLKTGDKKLQNSDRYRIYLQSYREDPVKFKPAFTKMMNQLLHRLQSKQGVTEAQSAKSGIYQTDVFGAKAYHAKCMEPNCNWESKRFDRIKQAQAAAEKHSKVHFKQGVAEDTLSEIYKMPPTKNSSQGMAVWAYNDALAKKSPVIYNDNNVIIYKANEELLRYIILQDGNPVLYIGLAKFLDGYKSGTVATEIAGRGKGLAQKAYINASDILGVPIYSDTTQTDASRLGIWDKLIQQYPNRIVGYDQKTNKNLPLSSTDKGPVVNQNQLIYVDRNKKDTDKPISPNQRYRTRILKLLPNKNQDVTEDAIDEVKKRKSKSKKGRTPRSITTGWWGVYHGDNSSGSEDGGGE